MLELGFGAVPGDSVDPGDNFAPRTSNSALETVRYFGDYEILEQIGRGGMGIVYKARQISLNRTVALKMISAGEFASPAAVQRFQIEAEAAAQLDHPNIVPIYEIGVQRGHHYFSMKFVEGRSLADEIREGEFQNASADGRPGQTAGHERQCAVVRLMASVARSVHHAHQHGVLHRDLKPSNILLDAGGHPHLTDFGLAKILEHEVGVTRSAEVMGTPSYMSPEQAAGCQLTTAADVYSLGAVLYELLAGQPPFVGETHLQVLRELAEQEPKSPRVLNPSIDRDLETICLRSLEKDAAGRYGSALAFAIDLEHWLRGEPVVARPVTQRERVIKWMRREPVLASAVGLLFAVFVLGIGGVLWQWSRAEQHADRERGQRERAEQATRRAEHALTQMEAIQLRRAEEFYEAGDRRNTLPYLALVLRQNPSNHLAAERLYSTLSHRMWARLACPPLLHSNRVTSAMFDKDGRRVVTSSSDGTAWVWDANNGQRIAGPLAHSAEINTAEFNADATLVVTASLDGTARVWDAFTGLPVSEPLAHSNSVWIARFTPSGHVVTLCRETVYVWDAVRGERVLPPLTHSDEVTGVDFSPQGEALLTGSRDKTARLWDLRTGQMLRQIEHQRDVASVRFSPDGERFVTASYDHTARVWNSRTGQHIGSPIQHRDVVGSAEFSADGQRIVTSSHDGTARVWDVNTGLPIGEPLTHGNRVRSAVFNSDGRRVVTASWDGTCRVWDATTGAPVLEPISQTEPVFHAEFHPDGDRILVASNGREVTIWDASGSASVKLGVEEPIYSFAIDPASGSFAVGSRSGATLVQRLLTAAPVARRIDSWGGGAYVEFSSDGCRIAIASDDNFARVWDVITGTPVSAPVHHAINLPEARFDVTGQRLVTVGWDKSARVWDATTGEPITPPLVHDAEVMHAQFSPDGKFVLTTSEDRKAHLWDAATGKLLHLLAEGGVNRAKFSPDGLRIVTAGADMAARIWDTQTGQVLGASLQHAHRLANAYYSPDGTRIACIVAAGGLPATRLWDVATRKTLGEPFPSGAGGRFSADGTRFVTVGDAKGKPFADARIWDGWTGQRLSEPFGRDVHACQLTADGTLLLTADRQNVYLWEAPSPPLPIPGWLPALAEGLAARRFNEQGALIPVEASQLWAEQEKIVLAGRARPLATGLRDEFYARWAKWFLANARTRTVLPSSALTLQEYAQRSNSLHALVAQTLDTKWGLVDLSRHHTSTLRDLPTLPRGLQAFGGIPFDVQALAGNARVEGIEVGRRCRALHFLGGCGFTASDGTQVGKYIIHFADGQSAEMPIVYGEDIRDWVEKSDPVETLTRGSIAWKGPHPYESGRIRLFQSVWQNPRPEVAVTSIDFVRRALNVAPFIVAITAELNAPAQAGVRTEKTAPQR